ncbi:hypothetical protein SORBI_3008G065300, partial [Sorghum bicolor]
SPLATSSARESRRRRRHTIRPPSPWHPCAAATATSLHIAVSRSLLCLRRQRGGHARALLHRRCLSPRPPSCSSAPSPSPPSPPLSSVSRTTSCRPRSRPWLEPSSPSSPRLQTTTLKLIVVHLNKSHGKSYDQL